MDLKSIQRLSTWGTGIAVGILLGVAVGVVLNRLAVGVLFGLVLGAALEIVLRRPVADQAPPQSRISSSSEQPKDVPHSPHIQNEERPL